MGDLNALFDQNLLKIGDLVISVRQVVLLAVANVALLLGYHFLYRRFLKRIIDQEEFETGRKPILRRWILMFILISLILSFRIIQIDFQFIQFGSTIISLHTALILLLVLSFSSLLDWISTYVLKKEESTVKLDDYHRRSKVEFSPGSNIQSIILTIAFIVFLKAMDWDFKIFSFSQGKEQFDFNFSRILSAVLIILIARFIIWMLKRIILGKYYALKKIELSTQFAINQLLSYIIYVIAVFVALENLGIQMTLIWGGAAALLVGIGLGLQQTFNDLVSGIILLFERTVEVGAVVEIGGTVGRVRKIGLRTSIVETRDNQAIIVPNSKLIVDIVRNWNHNDDKVRFDVKVGVAYGSDTELVRKILLQCAEDHPRVLDEPKPFVRFIHFGDSALELELHFWTRDLMPVENIKSDLRFAIDKAFRQNHIQIPFPQRDVWLRRMDAEKPK